MIKYTSAKQSSRSQFVEAVVIPPRVVTTMKRPATVVEDAGAPERSKSTPPSTSPDTDNRGASMNWSSTDDEVDDEDDGDADDDDDDDWVLPEKRDFLGEFLDIISSSTPPYKYYECDCKQCSNPSTRPAMTRAEYDNRSRKWIIKHSQRHLILEPRHSVANESH